MLLNFFGRGPKYADVQGENSGSRSKGRILIFVIIGAICVLAFSGAGGRSKNEKKDEKTEADITDIAAYTAETEKRLAEALEKINGAGGVEVMITFDSVYEHVLAKNSRGELSEDSGGEKISNTSNHEETVVLFGSGAAEKPYVLKEKTPCVSGVLVTAEGAGDEKVRLEIYEAVKALYGVSGHRVKVTAASVNK